MAQFANRKRPIRAVHSQEGRTLAAGTTPSMSIAVAIVRTVDYIIVDYII
jgi:hypothetical protein